MRIVIYWTTTPWHTGLLILARVRSSGGKTTACHKNNTQPSPGERHLTSWQRHRHDAFATLPITLQQRFRMLLLRASTATPRCLLPSVGGAALESANLLWKRFVVVCLFVVCGLRIKMSTLRSTERGCGKVVSLAFFFVCLRTKACGTRSSFFRGEKKEATSEQEKRALRGQRIESSIRVFWRHVWAKRVVTIVTS